MALTKEEKQAILDEYVERFSKSEAIILADYRGLSVESLTNLRRQLRDSGNSFMVVKNTLAALALQQAGRPVPADLFAGPVAVGLSYSDIAATAKVMNSVAAETKILTIKGAVIGKTVVSAEQARALADMPSRDMLLGQVVGTLQAPISGLVNVLAGTVRGLMNVLNARAEQLGGEAAS